MQWRRSRSVRTVGASIFFHTQPIIILQAQMAAIVSKATLSLKNYSSPSKGISQLHLEDTYLKKKKNNTYIHAHLILLFGPISQLRLTERQKCIGAGGHDAFFHMDVYTVKRREVVGTGERKGWEQGGRIKNIGGNSKGVRATA